MVVETMREGERVQASLHHKVAWGEEGHAALGIGPETHVEYEITLLKVYDIQEFEDGAIRRTILKLPDYIGRPEEGDEVTVRWMGDLLDGEGQPTKRFQHRSGRGCCWGRRASPSLSRTGRASRSSSTGSCGRCADTVTVALSPGEASARNPLPAGSAPAPGRRRHRPTCGATVCSDGRGRGARDGGGAELGVRRRGHGRLGVPRDSHVKIWLELVGYNSVEDISPSKNRSAIKRVLRRGRSEDTPHKGDEVTCGYKFRSGRTREVLCERDDFFFVLGDLPERAASGMRARCGGAHADTILTLLVSKLQEGATHELVCQPDFAARPEELVAEVTLKRLNKVIVCPGTDGQVR